MFKLRKITIFLFLCNILRKNWMIKLIFCMQVSMKACYKLIIWQWSKIPKVPKIASLQFLYSISEKKLKLKLIFCMQSFRVISTLWASTFPTRLILSLLMGMDKCFQIAQSNKFAIPCNISKKKLEMEIIFGMQISVKVSTGCCYPFWWK